MRKAKALEKKVRLREVHNTNVQLAKAEAEAAAKAEAEFIKGMKQSQINELKKKTDTSKVAGVTYIDLLETERSFHIMVDGKETQVKKKLDAPIATSLPWTTWSGFLILHPTSPLKERFVKECGAIPINADGTEATDATKAYAFAGYWTDPLKISPANGA